MSTPKDLEEYNEIPVKYCADCLSLRIRYIQSVTDSDYCDECGSTYIKECSIDEWNSMYRERYEHDYLDNY